MSQERGGQERPEVSGAAWRGEKPRGLFLQAKERLGPPGGASNPAGWGSPGGFSGSSCPAAPCPGLSPAKAALRAGRGGRHVTAMWAAAPGAAPPARGGVSCGVPAGASALPRGAAAEGGQQSHEEDDRKVRRREKNRVAAQRSRKKQTQKADKLHEEYESLEQENTSLKREIGKLTDEMKHLSEVLKDHEKICPLLHCTMNFMTIPRPDALASCLPR
ncbi:PREDICTED: basic leucine zipper transcriptional factor ATF-like 3 [Ficedula albicollis]|uniref:basic leucine zipper transcriptional factor ATF-like 3 n=1 Tax=Ficedula albicollis TaxID=59894 RepID=UPI0007AD7E9B|nr:PREDICTED: basic leucine zipper transcriptional factor ATF-like 3 [Ficedula albicollis]